MPWLLGFACTQWNLSELFIGIQHDQVWSKTNSWFLGFVIINLNCCIVRYLKSHNFTAHWAAMMCSSLIESPKTTPFALILIRKSINTVFSKMFKELFRPILLINNFMLQLIPSIVMICNVNQIFAEWIKYLLCISRNCSLSWIFVWDVCNICSVFWAFAALMSKIC